MTLHQSIASTRSAGCAGVNVIPPLTIGGHTDRALFIHAFTGAELAALANYTIGQFGFRQGAVTAQKIRAQRVPEKEEAGKLGS
jgi:hypothetical protein